MMKNLFEKIIALIIVLIFSFSVRAQNAIDLYNEATEHYQSGRYDLSIELLKKAEKLTGANPRIQSLLVYVYNAKEDYLNAKIELLKYKKLAPSGNSENHTALINMGKLLDEKINMLEKDFSTNIQNDRIRKADAAIQKTYSTEQQKKAKEQQEISRKRIETLQSEQDAFDAMLKKRDEDSAREFFFKYPKSTYRDSAYVLWQQRFVNSSKDMYGEPAVEKLNQYKNTFTYKPILPSTLISAKEVYNLKWNEALMTYNNLYNIELQDKNKAVSKTIRRYVISAGVGLAAGFGVAGLISMSSDEPFEVGKGFMYGGIFAGVNIGLDLLINPDPYNINRKNINISNYRKKVNYYSGPPVLQD